jgi:hypothetical protein
MEILGYGEDALTLWSLKNKLDFILASLGDSSDVSKCRAFFRPSFGRSGGNNSSQFGEFDFIILAEQCLYLGESKWDKSREKIINGMMDLRGEQLLRHRLFKFYIDEWAFGNYTEWGAFKSIGEDKLKQQGIDKPIAPAYSLLATNLQTVLRIIQDHYSNKPKIRNVLLYFYNGAIGRNPIIEAGNDFEVVMIDFSKDISRNYIHL